MITHIQYSPIFSPSRIVNLRKRVGQSCLVLLCGLFQMLGVTGAQAAPAVQSSVSDTSTVVSSLDIPSFLIRHWYTRPDKASFFGTERQGRWQVTPWDRLSQGWSVLGYVNPTFSITPSRDAANAVSPFSIGLAVQKDLSKSSAFRFGFDFADSDIPGNDGSMPFAKFQRFGLSVDHLWNLANHWNGFDPARSWEVLFVTGGSVGMSLPDAQKYDDEMYWQADLGLELRKTLSPRMSLFLQPYYYFGESGYDHDEANFEDGAGLRAGLLYRATPPFRQTPWILSGAWNQVPSTWRDNWYIQNLLGFNLPDYAAFGTSDLNTQAYNFSLDLGRWVEPAWGFRLGFVDRQLLPQSSGTQHTSYRHTFGRLEGVLNLMTLVERLSLGRIGLDASIGVESGAAREYQYSYTKGQAGLDKSLYLGLTGASQLKYFLNRRSALLAEARYTYVGRKDAVFTPSLGLEYYASTYPRYQSWLRRNRYFFGASADSTTVTFDSEQLSDRERRNLDRRSGNFFLELAAGAITGSNASKLPGDYSPMGAIALGYHIDSLHAVRLKDYALYHYPGEFSRLQNQLALDYLFDITNFWFSHVNSYNKEARRINRGNLSAFAGPLWSLRQKEEGGETKLDNKFGFNAGLRHAFALTPGLEFIIEPRYVYLFGEDNQWGLSTGAAYTFRHSIFKWPFAYSQQTWDDNWYFQNLLGLNLATIDDVYKSGHSISDYNLALNLGRWVKPSWGYRFGFIDSQILTLPYRDSRYTYRQTYARAEGVLNVPATWHHTSVGRLGMDLSAGIEAGLDREYFWSKDGISGLDKFYAGLTAAAQLKYYVNSHTALVGEARYTMFDRHAQVITPSLGIEYYRSTYPRFTPWLSRHRVDVAPAGTLSASDVDDLIIAADDYALASDDALTIPAVSFSQPSTESQSYSDPKNLFLELGLELGKTSNQATNPPGLYPAGEFAAGMHLDDFQSIRAKERLTYHRGSQLLDNHLSVDYMFNLSDFWFSHEPSSPYNRGRRAGLGVFSFRPFAGLLYALNDISTERVATTDVKQRFGTNFGIQHVLHLGGGFELYAEPRYEYLFDADNQWTFSAGVAYTPRLLEVGSWDDGAGAPGLSHNWYSQSLIGTNYTKVPGIHQSGLHLSRYNISTAIGRWVTPVWGFRVGFVDQQLLPDKQGQQSRESYRQTFGRLEGVINVPALWNEVSMRRIGLDISGGFEVGLNRYYHSSKLTSKPANVTRKDKIYPGFTVASQLKYFLNSNVALLGEARASIFDRTSFSLTPSVGVEVYGSTYPRYSKWLASNGEVAYTRLRRGDKDIHSANASVKWSKTPRVWFLDGGFGFTKHANDRNSTARVAPLAEVGIGVHLDTLHTVRLKNHIAYYSRAKYGSANFHNELSLDYMFNLTNFWFGTPVLPQGGQLAMRPFAGLVYSARQIFSKSLEDTHRFGANFGIQYAVRINPGLEVIAEPRYMALAGDLNHWAFSLGASYTIERNHYRTFSPGSFPMIVTHGNAAGGSWDFTRFYFQTLGGMQIATGSEFHGTDPYGNFDFTFGNNVARNVALQASLFSQQLLLGHIGRQLDHIQGLRIEAVADALGMFWPEANDEGYAWTLQGGYDFARSLRYDHHEGPTFATQARRRLGHTPAWLALQGRIQVYRHQINYTAWTLQAGIHYELPDGASSRFRMPSLRSLRQGEGELTFKATSAWSPYLEGGTSWYDANNFGYHVALGVNYHQLHGLRLSYDHAATPYMMNAAQQKGTLRRGTVADDAKIRLDMASLDYMFDVTTALVSSGLNDHMVAGTTIKPSRFHLQTFAGVNATYHEFLQKGEEPQWVNKIYPGLDMGIHATFRVLPHFNLYLEQKSMYQPYDAYLSPSGHKNWHLAPSAGLQLFW